MVKELKKKNNMASPNKIKNIGYDYKPFEMKAKAYDNSPVNKNYGSPAQRGFHIEGGVGDSPNKLFGAIGRLFKKGKKKVESVAEKALEKVGLGGGDTAAAGTVPPHGDEAHTGGGGGGYVDPVVGGAKDKALAQLQAMKGGGPWGGVGDAVGGGAVGDLAKQAVGALSDARLKEKIQRTGTSPSGIPIYEFNYIGDNNRYSGAMAQDLLDTDAVSKGEDGYYRVNYNNIDVDMHLIN
jgi:hypothetical protein